MTQNTYAVTGMSCGHCASSVKEEIGEIPGVRQVDVDVPTGKVVIVSDIALEPGLVENAVKTAGYQLVG
ncbi:heavy-metal-associated domain-containing protein [Amycolatopsis umgeniensis]|uniref:Copper chaperone CopZ n=1 Tax=Amycolatopsis umgeniensis TaxID=336628 RepID=A0A841B088_9PSEU|nr:heavy metal-associated domain-containing protein [Amycolatopsis umgeniensis]MBB5852291.1 copper chaperone CopZ [Amycolatopsis umgeniensis]